GAAGAGAAGAGATVAGAEPVSLVVASTGGVVEVTAGGDSARITGAAAFSDAGLTAPPSTTPNASSAITATAAPRGLGICSPARRRARTGSGGGSAGMPKNAGREPRRAPHSTQ